MPAVSWATCSLPETGKEPGMETDLALTNLWQVAASLSLQPLSLLSKR